MQMWTFWIAHAIILVAWMLLFARRSKGVMLARCLGLMTAVVYSIVFLTSLGRAGVLSEQYNLSGIATFFSDPNLALAGWIHYLVFDLWVGTWEVEEADRVGMSSASLYTSLVLTFFAGPLGLVAFSMMRLLEAEVRRRYASADSER